KFYLTQANLEPARHALEETVRLDPGRAEAWSMLANVRIKTGNDAGARTALERALRLRPDAPQDHLQFAVMLAQQDRIRAAAEYERAISLAPADAACHRQYGRFLLDAGDPSGAEAQER